MTSLDYVHGYTEDEATRLADQAGTLADLLHHDTHYPGGQPGAGSRVRGGRADANSGATKSGGAFRQRGRVRTIAGAGGAAIESEGLGNVEFKQADLLPCPFPTPVSITCSCASYWSTCAGPRRPCAPSCACCDRAAR